jgi:hypothetical protein
MLGPNTAVMFHYTSAFEYLFGGGGEPGVWGVCRFTGPVIAVGVSLGRVIRCS